MLFRYVAEAGRECGVAARSSGQTTCEGELGRPSPSSSTRGLKTACSSNKAASADNLSPCSPYRKREESTSNRSTHQWSKDEIPQGRAE